MEKKNITPFKTVGVIGVGNIGASLTVDLALHGIQVVAVDNSEKSIAKARDGVHQMVRMNRLFGKKGPKPALDETLARINFTTKLEDVSKCEFIVENIPEDWNLKKPLYEKLDKIAPPNVFFGVNTSCISITRVGGSISRPDKVVGVHFMNPVYLMPTVEVIRGERTSADTLAAMHQLLSQLNKEAVVVKDFPGFVSNRISHIFMNEAAFVFQDGLATAAEIDTIFKKCFSHKMGPLETADLIGIDTVANSLDVLFESFKDSKFRCCPLLRKMADAGYCGRKSGRGFYEYPGSETTA